MMNYFYLNLLFFDMINNFIVLMFSYNDILKLVMGVVIGINVVLEL